MEGAYTRMITKVRIAPVEQWCKETTPHEDTGDVGVEVEIDTASMQKSTSCPGRRWLMTEESTEMLCRITGAPRLGQRAYICEHMLELGD